MPTNLTEFRQHVMPSLPKAPTLAVDKAVRDAVVEFAKRSHRMQEDIAAITTVAATHTYAIPNPVGFQVLALSRLFYDGTPLWSVSENQLDLNWQALNDTYCICSNEHGDDWRSQEADCPTVFYQATPNEVRLVATPTTGLADALTGRVVVYPLPGVTVIDDDIYNEYYESIAAGALSRLMAVPSQPWSSPQMVAYYRAMFDEGVADARGKVVRGHAEQNAQQLRTTSHP